MNQPKVTVVIPVYNVEKYIKRCVDTVVSQSYNNLEILLVDDGSTDNSSAICDALAKEDDRISVIHKQNFGLGMARNTGIENATGEYIFFFDSDDYVDLEVIEKCVKSAQANGSEVVIFGQVEAFEDGTVKNVELNVQKTVFKDTEITDRLLPAMFTYDMGFGASCCMKMFSLEVIKRENVRFKSEREIISEDAFFVLEYFNKIKAASIVSENLYYYYKRSGSLTTSFRKDRQAQNNVFLQKAFEYVDAAGLPKHIKHHVAARYHMYVIAALKHIYRSDLSKAEQKAEINSILHDSILHQTLGRDVTRLHKLSLRILFDLLKIKAYFLCRVLLGLKEKMR